MDFTISEDRRMLADTLRRYLAEQYPIEHRNKVAYEAPWHDAEKWDGLAELGVLFALAPEDAGGMGGSGFDIAVLFEEVGRALCPEPLLPAAMAAHLLHAVGADLEPLLSGTRHAVALGELDAPYDLDTIGTVATRDGGQWRLSGRKSVVCGAPCAEQLLVAARHGGGLGLFLLPAASAQITGYGMIDGGPAGDVFLENAAAQCLSEDATAMLTSALDIGALALSAEALGAMQTANDMLVDYLKTRQQFGKPIGTFQALQHRVVDLAIELEQARSAVILAADAMGTAQQSTRVSQCKHLVGKIAHQVAEEVIQMHGGIAMTWEYPASHYAKRLVMIDHQMGDTDWHLERLIGTLQSA